MGWVPNYDGLSQVFGILSKLRHNAPLVLSVQIYYALFYSKLIYGCNAWGLTSKKNRDLINDILHEY